MGKKNKNKQPSSKSQEQKVEQPQEVQQQVRVQFQDFATEASSSPSPNVSSSPQSLRRHSLDLHANPFSSHSFSSSSTQQQQPLNFGSGSTLSRFNALYAAQSAPDLTRMGRSTSSIPNNESQESLGNFLDTTGTFLLTPVNPNNAAEIMAANPGSTLVKTKSTRSPEQVYLNPPTSTPTTSAGKPPTPTPTTTNKALTPQNKNHVTATGNNNNNNVSSGGAASVLSSTKPSLINPNPPRTPMNTNSKGVTTSKVPTLLSTPQLHQKPSNINYNNNNNRSSGGGGSGHNHHSSASPVFSRHVEGYFVPILALTAAEPNRRDNQDFHPEGTAAASNWNKLVRLFGGIVLISKVQWQNVLLWIASYQYIPLMAAVCVTTANALLAVAATAILPVIEFISDENFYNPHTDNALNQNGENAGDNTLVSYLLSGVGLASSTATAAAAAATTSNLPSTAASLEHGHNSTSFGAVIASAALSFFIVLGTAVVGYKQASMVGDAFLDACRVVVDRRTHYTLPFYSLYCDICRIFVLGGKYVAVFVCFLIGIPAFVLWSVLGGRYGIDKRPAFVIAFFATIFEVGWIIFQTIRFVIQRKMNGSSSPSTKSPVKSPADASSSSNNTKTTGPKFQLPSLPKKRPNANNNIPSETASETSEHDQQEEDTEDEEDYNPNNDSATANATGTQLALELQTWWARKIPKVRRRGFTVLFFAAILITMGSGLLHGLIALVEGFLYVSFVHLVAHIAARSTLFFRAVHLAIKTLYRDAAAAIVTLIIAPILLAIAIANYFRFGFYLAFIQIPVLVIALINIASHARELRDRRIRKQFLKPLNNNNNKNTTSYSIRDYSIMSSILFVLWRVLLLNPRRSFDYGAHWRYAQYLRVCMRGVITIFFGVVVFLSTWVSFQSIHFRYEGFEQEMTRIRKHSNDSMEILTKSFDLFLEKRTAEEKKQQQTSRKQRNQQEMYLYQGMCQRSWLTDDEQEDLFDEKSTTQNSNNNMFNALYMSDLAFFSMLAYVPNLERKNISSSGEESSSTSNAFTELFNFYKRHRTGASSWELLDQTSFVWEELRKIQTMQHDFGIKIEKERREILRFSQLHLVESLRPPFFHFRRPRPDTENVNNKMKSSSSSEKVIAYDNLFVGRGTELSFAADFWQNVIIFADVFLVEQLANFVPGVGLLPIEFVRDLVSATNFIARTPEALFYHTHMQKYIRATQLLDLWRNRKATPAAAAAANVDQQQHQPAAAGGVDPNRQRLVDRSLNFGHSLAGVSSQLAAPPLGVPAVAFSAPGIVYMSRKFGVTAEATEGLVTNVVVSNDVIPLIGTVNGEVHNIYCEHDGSLECHSILLTFWRFMERCPFHREKLFGGMKVNKTLKHSPMVLTLHEANRWLEIITGMKLTFEKFV